MKRRFSGVKTFLTNYRYFWDTFLRQNSCITEGQRRIHDIRKEAGEKFRHYTFQTYYGHIHNHQNPEEFRKTYATLVIVKKTSWNINLEIRAKQALTVPASYMLMAASTSLTGCAQEAKSIEIILDLVQNCTALQSSMQCVVHTMPVCKMALYLRRW